MPFRAAFVPAAGVTRAFAVTASKDAVDIALAAIKDGTAGAVKEWTVVALKTTTAGAFEEAARQVPSSKSLQGLGLVTGKVFTVLQFAQTIKAAADDLIGYEDSLASLRIQLQEVRTLIRDLQREYRTLIEQFERMQAQARVA